MESLDRVLAKSTGSPVKQPEIDPGEHILCQSFIFVIGIEDINSDS